ncbi:MAG: hypothetical protein HYZ14_03185 [Bacteroidetes bacterium]|nr:hypothetical protein [Bacteroidota bacterium]
MDLTQFRSDSKRFSDLTRKPLVLDEFMTWVFMRPIIDIVKTNKPFERYQDDHNISMKEHMNLFDKEANEIIEKYLPQLDEILGEDQ